MGLALMPITIKPIFMRCSLKLAALTRRRQEYQNCYRLRLGDFASKILLLRLSGSGGCGAIVEVLARLAADGNLRRQLADAGVRRVRDQFMIESTVSALLDEITSEPEEHNSGTTLT